MTAKDGKPCKKCGGNKWNNARKCVACTNAAHQRRRSLPENRERENEAARKRWAENPEKAREAYKKWKQKNIEQERERARQWHRNDRQNNPEKARERARNRYRNNPEKIKEQIRRYRKQNPGKKVALDNRRRTRLTQAGGSFTDAEWKSLVSHYGGKCLCCGRSDVELTVDHVIPVVSGGTSNIDNLQPLCRSCNSKKRDKTIDYRPHSGLGRWIQRKLFG